MTTPDPAGLEPLRGPKTPRSQKHGLKSQKHPPKFMIQSIVYLISFAWTQPLICLLKQSQHQLGPSFRNLESCKESATVGFKQMLQTTINCFWKPPESIKRSKT